MTEDSSPIVATVPQYSLWSRNCVFILYGLIDTLGAIQVAFPDSAGLYLLFALFFALAATFGPDLIHSLARSKPIVPILQMLYFLVWPIGAMVYLISRSGWRGLGIGLMHGVGLFVTLSSRFT